MTIFKKLQTLVVTGLLLVSVNSNADNSVVAVFEVDETALYRVSHGMLLSRGIDLSGIPVNEIGLYKGGRRAWGVRVVGTPDDRSIFGSGGYLLFAGVPREDRFNETGRYTLKVDADINPNHAMLDSTPVASTGGVYTGHWDSVYSNDFEGYHSDSPSQLPYYSHRLTTNNNGNDAHDISIELINPRTGNGSAVVAVELWGGNKTGVHNYTIQVNGTPAGSGSFNGESLINARHILPRALLNNGTNTVTVINNAGSGFSRFYVGRARIGNGYDHRAVNNHVSFYQPYRATPRPHLIKGFTSNSVFVVRLRGQDMVYYTRDTATLENDGTYSIKVPGVSDSGRYFVSTWAGTKQPTITVPDYSLEQNARTADRADVFFITPSDFIDSAPLVDLNNAVNNLGYSTKVVSLESIYDEFYSVDGRVSPDAIRSFVRYASRYRGGQYFVLVGGESHDQLDRLGYGSYSLIPTYYIETLSMRQTPSDSLFGDTSIPMDYIPEVSVSRLPAFTVAELQYMVNKSILFMNQTDDFNSLFISDKNDAFNSNYSFLSDSQQIGSYLAGVEVQRSLQTTSIGPLRTSILNRLNSGGGAVNYVGHSSLAKFGLQDTIFDDVDAASLTNVGTPFVMNMLGCNTNDFTLPNNPSLGMALMTGNGNAGAASVIGQTARVNPFHSTLMAKTYYQGLSEGKTQGQALVDAQRAFAEQQGNSITQRDVLIGTNILGLPLLNLSL